MNKSKTSLSHHLQTMLKVLLFFLLLFGLPDSSHFVGGFAPTTSSPPCTTISTSPPTARTKNHPTTRSLVAQPFLFTKRDTYPAFITKLGVSTHPICVPPPVTPPTEQPQEEPSSSFPVAPYVEDTSNQQVGAATDIIPSSSFSTEKFLIHRGRSQAMILRSPSIAGIGLCKGWTRNATEAFVQAVDHLVEANPILTGRVYKNSRCGRDELRIQAGKFSPKSHEFVQILDLQESPEMKSWLGDVAANENTNPRRLLSPQQQVDHIVQHCFPLLEESELTSVQIQKKLPLFGATLILLPNHHAVYAMKVSHAVGDGVTFFMLLKQLSMFMSGMLLPNNKEVHPSSSSSSSSSMIDWHHPLKPTHELFAPGYSTPRDIEVMYGAPFMLGAAKNILTKPWPRQGHVLLLDKNKVNDKKQQLRVDLKCKDISSNDVITAALCQSGTSSDMFVFTENARSPRRKGSTSHDHHEQDAPGTTIPPNAAGNFLVEVPISRERGSQPDQLRQAVRESQQGNHNNVDYGSIFTSSTQEQTKKTNDGQTRSDPLPTAPFLQGRVGRITSLATIPANLLYEGTEQICTMPYLSFLEQIPLDTALIFRYDKDYWGVIHNFEEMDLNVGMLGELVSQE